MSQASQGSSSAPAARVEMSRFPAEFQGTGDRADSLPMSIEVTNGLPEGADHSVSLELTLAEAEAVKSWLLKPSADGSAAIDDENAKSVMVKLGAKLGIRSRTELAASRPASDGRSRSPAPPPASRS